MKVITTNLPERAINRLKTVARANDTTFAATLRRCIERALPSLEREAGNFAGVVICDSTKEPAEHRP